MKSALIEILASLGGAAGVGSGAKTILSWLSQQARREGKTDQLLEQLTQDVTDLKDLSSQLVAVAIKHQDAIEQLQEQAGKAA